MTIVYTINGEGMGHASRSSVVIEHLRAAGHRIIIVSSGERPLQFLRERFGHVHAVQGLHMVYRDNSVRRARTAAAMFKNAGAITREIGELSRDLKDEPIDAVISDFDFRGYLIARKRKVPLISIDNIQYLRFASLRVPAKEGFNFRINLAVASFMVPRAQYWFITTFDPEPKMRSKTPAGKVFLVPPLLRSRILSTRPTRGPHILVYQTSGSNQELMPVLQRRSEKFIVYNSPVRIVSDHITVKPFDEETFINDLASSRAVITNGGFNVITEALYFKKPVLSVPVGNHYEQQLNALLLHERNLGMMSVRVTNQQIDELLRRASAFERAAGRLQFGNTPCFTALDGIVESIVSIRGR